METEKKYTQGKWKLFGMQVLADPIGDSNYETAIPVCHTFQQVDGKANTADAKLIACAPEFSDFIIEAYIENMEAYEAVDARDNEELSIHFLNEANKAKNLLEKAGIILK